MTGLIAAALAPFFFEVTPEVRSTYVSLGKILEDRPMQVTNVRAGWDTGDFGRFGVRNWDVSSLTDRRHDVHRHALYHMEFGPTWQYDWEVADKWTLRTDLTRSWTLYRGFRDSSGDKTFHWWQIDQSLENPYLVPFYRIRRAYRTNDYLYFKLGVRRRFTLWRALYATPSVFVEGGNSHNYRRVFGTNTHGDDWGEGGVSSFSARLELGWTFTPACGTFAYVEQYAVTGGDARATNADSSYRCAHNDWTHGGVGIRLRF